MIVRRIRKHFFSANQIGQVKAAAITLPQPTQLFDNVILSEAKNL